MKDFESQVAPECERESIEFGAGNGAETWSLAQYPTR